MLELFYELGFTRKDVALMSLCAFGSALGSFIQVVVAYWHGLAIMPSAKDEPPRMVPWAVSLQKAVFLLSRLTVGATLGALFALYLTGALTEGVTVIARVLVFSVLIGYSAPRIWESQQRTIESVIDKIFLEKFRSAEVLHK